MGRKAYGLSESMRSPSKFLSPFNPYLPEPSYVFLCYKHPADSSADGKLLGRFRQDCYVAYRTVCPCQALMRFFFAKYISISDEGAVLSNATPRAGEIRARGYEMPSSDEGKVGGKRGKKDDRSCNILGSHCTCPISWQASSLSATA